MLYACDRRWWDHSAGVPEFAGLKVTGDRQAAVRHGLRVVWPDANRNELLLERAGWIGYGGNSGFQALNLALQFGAMRLVLVGFDLTLAAGVHWHGKHEGGLNNPSAESLARWARTLDRQAPMLEALGIEVLNASPASALTAFPKVPLEDALGC